MVVVEDVDVDVITLEHSAEVSSTLGFSAFFFFGLQIGGSTNCELDVESNEKF